MVKEKGVYGTMCWVAKHKEINYLMSNAKTKVGEDEFGNEYFEDTSQGRLRGRDRWVIFNGPNNSSVFDYPYQPSAIPPTWHAWMTQNDDRVPPSGEKLNPCTAEFVVAGSEVPSTYDHVAPWRPNQTGEGTRQSTGCPGTGMLETTGFRPM